MFFNFFLNAAGCWASTPISTKISRRPGLASIAWLYHQSQRPNKMTRELTEPHPLSSSGAAWGQDNSHSPGPLLMGWAGRWSRVRHPLPRAKQQGPCTGRKGGRHTARREACDSLPESTLLPHVLRSYHPLRVTSHTPPEQNPLCSRQTSLSQMPQTILPHPPLGVQLGFARASRFLRGLFRSPGNPPTHTQAGSPY